ncbi:hypothetical protein [Sulfuricurvum sp.]|uniref:hypothetical protein n=1 Tax=Sulfuricurvum sp. TaxID=2025608 RepID=UPI002629F6B6|nr:hypothetical protein [Sulfuricurvum sp.]MDD4950496.1 hypothetical protein [Sulfuricurvum sp.]
MDECPAEMSFEECLKQMMKRHHVQNTKVVETQFKNIPNSSHPIFMKSSFIGGGGGRSLKSISSHSNFHSHTGSYSGGGFVMSFGHGNNSYVSGGFSVGGGSWRTAEKTVAKGGVVVKNQTVVIKSNFEMAGRLNQQGKRPNAKAVGTHASASLDYMDNHGSKDLDQEDGLSNTYDENGERMSKDELDAMKKELNGGIGAFRRTVIDTGQKEFDRDDLNRLVRESMQTFQEQTGKSFEYSYAIHTDTDHTHAHVLSYGKTHEINMTKEHLQLFKEIAADKTEELLREKVLDHDRHLSLHQKIDKALDGVLDDKDDYTQTKTQSLSL